MRPLGFLVVLAVLLPSARGVAPACKGARGRARLARVAARADLSGKLPRTPRAALRTVLGALNAALTDGRAGLCVELSLPSLHPMAHTFEPEAMADFALVIADELARRAAERARAVAGAPAPGPVRMVCSPPAVLAALEARLVQRDWVVADGVAAAPSPPLPTDLPAPAPSGLVVASIVGDEALPLGGVQPGDSAVVFVCPCAIDAEEWSPIWPIREALRAARAGRTMADGSRMPRAVVTLNSRFYAEPAELRGFEQAYLCAVIDSLPAAARTVDAAGTGGSWARLPAATEAGALLPAGGSGLGGGATVPLPELAIERAYPGRWRLLARERGVGAADVSPGGDGWRLVEERQTRPDGKALALAQVQLAYAQSRRAQQALVAAGAHRDALAAAAPDAGDSAAAPGAGDTE
ncbi:hypothetical protein T492DRAFT_1055234 [Pavlovales sp. CCMP2436]|nr:hypothetical protein T492DRAFT_1055234 [Pavlovales sp. CCMP2436]